MSLTHDSSIHVTYRDPAEPLSPDEVFLGRTSFTELLDSQRESQDAPPVSLVKVAHDMRESGIMEVAVRHPADPEISAAIACLRGFSIPDDLARYLARFSNEDISELQLDPQYKIVEAFREYTRGFKPSEALIKRGEEFWRDILGNETRIGELSARYKLHSFEESIGLMYSRVEKNGTGLVVCDGYAYAYGFQILDADLVIGCRVISKDVYRYGIGKISDEVLVNLEVVGDSLNLREDRARARFNRNRPTDLPMTEGDDSWRISDWNSLFLLGPESGSVVPPNVMLERVDQLKVTKEVMDTGRIVGSGETDL